LTRRTFAALGFALLASACVTTPGGPELAERDPLEKFNRGVFSFNKGLDNAVVRPATKAYRAVTPQAAQIGVRNVLNNVDEPFSFINAILQGKIGQAFRILDRFVINTTLGVGGLADHATDMGIPQEPEDFGQTLAVWGVKSGPYIMLPLFGPSTLRDTVGRGVEFAGGDPYRQGVSALNLSTVEDIGLNAVELADTRSFIMDTADVLLRGSADEYSTVRSAYLQARQSVIYDGAPPEDDPLLPASIDAPANAAPAPASPPPAAEPAQPPAEPKP
jgi:phospholipid-binding lipoprotein MlaA